MATVLPGGIVEFFAEAARSQGVPGSVGAAIDALRDHGVINQTQWRALSLTDPRRSGFEVNLILQKILKEGVEAIDDSMFEEIEQAGSRYFFENCSPLVRFRLQ